MVVFFRVEIDLFVGGDGDKRDQHYKRERESERSTRGFILDCVIIHDVETSSDTETGDRVAKSLSAINRQ